MTWLQLLLIALGLSMDAFAVALVVGASGRLTGGRAAFRLSFHFGLFQFLMPVAGWTLAFKLRHLIEASDHWVAFGLLWAVGLHMLWDSVQEEKQAGRNDPSRGMSLVALSLATSVDAFAVGISLALLGETILWPSLVIGGVAGALSLSGVKLGSRVGGWLGQKMGVAGALILLGIGVQIVLAHAQ